ncbi:MAG TPA: maleylpyruvate isomerase N-terminal domain-containing protein [Actinoplanes sp.]|nr:maleylpyruvate isomerase N-terminal domain-containing protein [Actinoplanes sp.]
MNRADTLSSLWAAWAARGRVLTPAQWEAPTRLPPWTVRALFAHASPWPHWLTYVLTQVRSTPPTHETAADLMRAFNAPDGVATLARQSVADRAVADAATHTPEEMIDAFATVGPQALAAARSSGDVVVDYLGTGVLRLDEVLTIGIVEATVHLLDLQRALGLEPSVPAAALEHTADVLARIGSPVAFIEAATGRTKKDVFPVLT